jgi:hypothetical protein
VSEIHEQADEANANEQVSGGEKSYPEWLQGDPDVDRLVSYADNLRKERADHKQRLAEWDDEETAFRRVQEKFPHWLEADSEEETDNDDYEVEDDDDPRFQKLSELEKQQASQAEWIAQQQRQEGERAFNADVDELATAREVQFDEDDRDLIAKKAISYGSGEGFTKKELEKAIDWLVARDERVASARLEKVKSSKRAPHVPTGGSAGKGPQPDMRTEAGRKAFYEQKLANG